MRPLCPIFGSGFLKEGPSIAIIVPPALTFKYLLKPFGQFPVLWFSAEFIQFVAEIGGSIGFDGYLLGGPDIDEMSM